MASVWTHVNASIRIDAYRSTLGEHSPLNDLDKVVTYRDIMQAHKQKRELPKTKLPMGSEGSLNYILYQDTDLSVTSAYVLVIFGDLRDYNNTQEIIDYINTISKNWIIRSGLIEVTVSDRGTSIWAYDDNENTFTEVYSS